jgi:ribosomal protein L7/L12
MKTKKERIKEAMENFSIGMLEAKRMVEKVDLMAQIDRAQTVDDIKDILRQMNR